MPRRHPSMKSLSTKFDDHWIGDTTLMTPDRTRIQWTGPMPTHLAEFLTMALSARHDAKFVKSLKRLTKRLSADETDDERLSRFPFHLKRHRPDGWLYVEFAACLGPDFQSDHFIEGLEQIVKANPKRVFFDLRKTDTVSTFWVKALAKFNGRVKFKGRLPDVGVPGRVGNA